MVINLITKDYVGKNLLSGQIQSTWSQSKYGEGKGKANPGLAAIEAALEPESTDYYYYALGKDGRHHYSKTLNEHNAFVNSSEYGG